MRRWLKKQKTVVIVVAVAVLLLAAGAVFYVSRRQPSLPAEKASPAPSPAVGESPSVAYDTFTTGDGRLSFDYPSSWTQTEIKNLSSVLPQGFIDRYEVSLPLILSDPRGARIVLALYRFDAAKSLDEVMDALIEESAAFGVDYEEENRVAFRERLVVDSVVETEDERARVRDVLWLSAGGEGAQKNSIYNLSFTASENYWEAVLPIFDHVQESAALAP